MTFRSERWRRLLDLQYQSILLALRKRLRSRPLSACAVLDVGSGNAPYRPLFAGCKEYVTVDPSAPADFASVYAIPAERKFDLILVVEVLEHVKRPSELLNRLRRRLNDGGEIWISVPFAARIHRVPEDYWRWTDAGLRDLILRSGLSFHEVEPRGSDFAALAAKAFRLLFRMASRPMFTVPAFLLGIVLVPILLPLAQLSLRRARPAEDPLGLFAVAGA